MKHAKALAVVAAFAAVGALAQVPSIVNYQGRLSVDGANVFDGPGLFKFAMVSAGTNTSRQATATVTVSGGFLTAYTVTDGGTGYLETPAVTVTDPTGSNAVAHATITGGVVTGITVGNPGRNYSGSPVVTIEPPPAAYVYGTFWSNDSTSAAGSEPAAAVPVTVTEGLFSVNLGNTGLPNMTAVLDPAVFANPDLHLRVWFSDGVTGFQQFYPDEPLASAPYAMVAGLAGAVPDASITSASFAPGAVGAEALAANSVSTVSIQDGAVTSAKLAQGAVDVADLADNAVTTAKLADASVTTDKLQDTAVTAPKLAAGAVGTSALANGAVTTANIADGAVTASKLTAGVVDASKLADGAVSTVKLQDGAVTLSKLAPELRVPAPIGSIIAWPKNLSGTPVLAAGWAECNGQVLDDPSSPYHGTIIPNLNGAGGATQRFLRGSTTSGAVGGEDTHTLTVAEMPNHTHDVIVPGGTSLIDRMGDFGKPYIKAPSGATGGDQAHENRPPYYEVVWIIRVH